MLLQEAASHKFEKQLKALRGCLEKNSHGGPLGSQTYSRASLKPPEGFSEGKPEAALACRVAFWKRGTVERL